MSKAIYIATSEPNSGKSIVTLGLMRMLLGRTASVGYFRPIIDDFKEGETDNHIDTVLSHFEIDLKFEEAYAFKRSEIVAKRNNGKVGEVLDTIIQKFKALEEKFDFLLVEGTDFSGEGLVIEMDVNVLIAKNLGIPTIIVGSGMGKTLDGLVTSIHIAYDSFQEKDVKILAVIANKVEEENIDLIKNKIQSNLPEGILIEAIPKVNSLANPTVKEIADALDANVILGEKYLNNQVENVNVGAMQLRNYLTHLKKDNLVITPGDRADLILGALQANLSENYPKISGIVLTGGLIPEDSIVKLIEGLSQIVPIISVEEGTFATANRVGAIDSKIYANNKEKILTSIKTFDEFVEQDRLAEKVITFESQGMTPRMFQYDLVQRAKKEKKHIVLPEGTDKRVLEAAARLSYVDIVTVTLLGDLAKIQRKATALGLSINYDKIHVVNPVESEYYDDFVETFYNLRKHKNVNIDMAKDMMADVSYFGTMMVYKGFADGMVSGAAHTTQHTIRPALQFIKTKPNVSVVSSVFFMCLEDRVSVFGDCAINPNPSASQLAEIAISSAESTKAFGIEPRIAMLSYSSGTSGKGEEVDKVRAATEIIKKMRPDLKVEGPIQYDAAVDFNIGKSKLPDSEVAGQANVLIFPDLNTGNNTYKAVQRETGALAIGPMLQGLNMPVNDLSRGCTVDDIYNTVILTAIQAQGL